MSSTIHDERYAVQPGMLREDLQPGECAAQWGKPGCHLQQPVGINCLLVVTAPSTAEGLEEDPERWDGLA